MMIFEQDSGCSRRPEGRADPSQEPGEAGDHEMRDYQEALKIASRPSALSTLKKLQMREIGMPAKFTREKFRGIQRKIVLDLYMQPNREALEEFEPFMRNRSAVIKIIPVKDIIVLLSRKGVGMSFSRVTNDLLAFITRKGEMTEDIFYNKKKNSLIVGSSRRSDGNTVKEYRVIPMGMLRKLNNTGHSIFTSEQVRNLLIFHAVNEQALMTDGTHHKIFDLNTYSLMYKIAKIDVADFVWSPRALLVVKEKRHNLLPLVIKCLDSDEEVTYIYHPTENKVEFVELLNEKILIKEKSQALQIIDVKNSEQNEVPIGPFKYCALYGRNMFLTFQNKEL